MIEKPTVDYQSGLFYAAHHGTDGFRLVYYQNLNLGVEIF